MAELDAWEREAVCSTCSLEQLITADEIHSPKPGRFVFVCEDDACGHATALYAESLPPVVRRAAQERAAHAAPAVNGAAVQLAAAAGIDGEKLAQSVAALVIAAVPAPAPAPPAPHPLRIWGPWAATAALIVDAIARVLF